MSLQIAGIHPNIWQACPHKYDLGQAKKMQQIRREKISAEGMNYCYTVLMILKVWYSGDFFK
jgi:hypothetical protein